MGQHAILYVDDQQSHQALFRKAFQSEYSIITASSGLEGLELLKKNDVFLVIADHNMPFMTGIDFLEKANEVRPQVLQAILSAYTDESILKEAFRRTKMIEFLTKPWKLDRVKHFLSQAYQDYEIKNPSVGLVPEIHPQEVLSWEKIVAFVQGLEEVAVDKRGAKRIFLNHVEPPLREYVPLIRRPCPALLVEAQEHALSGNFDKVQEILANYLRQVVLLEQIEPIMTTDQPAIPTN